MHCTHCGASDIQKIFREFSILGDPFCDLACKNGYYHSIHLFLIEQQSYAYMDELIEPKVNWKRDGF